MSFTFTDIIYLGTATPGSGGGGGGSGLPDQTGHSGEFLTTDGTDASWAAISGGLPSQTGQSGKFLTTDGTDASWSDTPLVNSKLNTAQKAVGILGYAGANTSIAIGSTALTTGAASVAVGESTQTSGAYSTAIGYNARTSKLYAIQLGYGTNDEQNTFRVGLAGGAQYNYKLLDSDGTIPTDRLPNAINKYSTMPTAAATNVGWIVQFTGATDSTYTHGYIYECKAQGTTPETYAWEAVSVQAGGSGIQNTATGTDALTILGNPTATYNGINIGYNSTTSGNSSGIAIGSRATASNSVVGSNGNISIGASSKSTSSYESIAIGAYAESSSNYGIALGKAANCKSTNTISIGYYANCGTNSDSAISIGYSATSSAQSAISIGYATTSSAQKAIQLGYGGTNSDANTFKVSNANGNFEMMSADGTIPAARHATLPAADGTYVLKLVIASGVPTLSWVAE